MSLISVDDALALVLKDLKPLEVETVRTAEASGRVLAETLAASMTQPPFDASAMDGYAVRKSDVAPLPAALTVVGESAAGSGFAGTLEAGQAVRIFTGAPVPRGADAIVIQEDVEAQNGKIVVKAEPQDYIRPKGQDFCQGDTLLEKGTRLGPRALMLAATANYGTLPVHRRPRVAILATGNELVPPGSALGSDQIAASVACGIGPLVTAAGAVAEDLGIARDTQQSLVDHIGKASGADILVTVGGASVGAHDLVKDALSHEGFRFDFSKVAMRPGKPLFHGRNDTLRVLGVPGNPVSALVCSYIFLTPMLRALLGTEVPESANLEAELGTPLPENGPRRHYIRATSHWSADGTRIVVPLPSQDSSLVAALAKADCLIVQPARAPASAPGTRVKILPFSTELSS